MSQAKNFSILNEKIRPGETRTLQLRIAQLHTMTELNIPVIVSHSKRKGPVVLLSAGMHGDELNGVEIIRQTIRSGLNQPQKGTIICIPIVNVFGFVNQSREFPDGRDLNRVFPGNETGSLASQFAYNLMTHIIPKVDYVLDFHAGGRSRFNAAQIRIEENKPELEEIAHTFQTPFLLYSKNIEGSFRESCDKLGVKYLLFEGGKSLDINQDITQSGINGIKRFLQYLNMLNSDFQVEEADRSMIYIQQSSWIRADSSGMFRSSTPVGSYVVENQEIAYITDPYGSFETPVLAPHSGYIINENQAPIVFQGDAIFHISTKLREEEV
ncbi:MAG: succinylglutamate desuccinylase/aspartoacylase family protein [Weeksellaceae bacterium]|jgi:predicted deacylase|nr:succinylglutamate desuccinylase/aspartoacylase family protein [Weeksellaceae bacterium]MDX9705544.1 succinylglutamate desuccinylase/aspartoacylase family protein [Weeksellaceae bacterium]